MALHVLAVEYLVEHRILEISAFCPFLRSPTFTEERGKGGADVPHTSCETLPFGIQSWVEFHQTCILVYELAYDKYVRIMELAQILQTDSWRRYCNVDDFGMTT